MTWPQIDCQSLHDIFWKDTVDAHCCLPYCIEARPRVKAAPASLASKKLSQTGMTGSGMIGSTIPASTMMASPPLQDVFDDFEDDMKLMSKSSPANMKGAVW